MWPIADLTAVARRHGARTVLDAAQLAAHGPLRMAELDVDWIALSGHKMYAPFGVGALIGRTDWLQAAQPYLAGGGATRSVAESAGGLDVRWADVPERHEAGSPNLVGVHALATACEALLRYGWPRIDDYERELTARLRSGLGRIPAVRILGMWNPDARQVGVTSFSVDGIDRGLLSTVLSAEYGIGVREGAFCAHLATRTLLRNAGTEQRDGALRASIGLGTTVEHVDRLVAAVDETVRNGPGWTYSIIADEWTPVPDPRPAPAIVGTGSPTPSGHLS